MPLKNFIVGESATAADVNDYLMAQTVPRFTNAAQRTTQLAAPDLNQLSILDTRPGVLQWWNGSAWADTDPFIQTGSSVPTTDAFGSANCYFPLPFASAARGVLATNGDIAPANATYSFWVGLLNLAHTASSFTVGCVSASGPVVSTYVRIDWIAIGARP